MSVNGLSGINYSKTSPHDVHCTKFEFVSFYDIGALSTIWHAWGWLVSVPALTDAQQAVTFTVNKDKNTNVSFSVTSPCTLKRYIKHHFSVKKFAGDFLNLSFLSKIIAMIYPQRATQS
jgi:hypothetical protein